MDLLTDDHYCLCYFIFFLFFNQTVVIIKKLCVRGNKYNRLLFFFVGGIKNGLKCTKVNSEKLTLKILKNFEFELYENSLNLTVFYLLLFLTTFNLFFSLKIRPLIVFH